MSTVAYITARGLFGRRRFLLLLPLPLLMIGLALICRALRRRPAPLGPAGLVGPRLRRGPAGDRADRRHRGARLRGRRRHDRPHPDQAAAPPRHHPGQARWWRSVVTAVTAAVPLFVAGVLADSARLGLALAVGARSARSPTRRCSCC